LAEINPSNSLLVGILAYMPLFAVNPTGGQTGEGDGIGVAVFFTTFFFTGFLVGFFVVDEADGLADPVFDAMGVAFKLGLALGVGEAAYADESRSDIDVIAAISKFRFTLCSI
jgi:hypothetical protein